ncbi:MAG: HU family DNA-binding protein [Planctomycetota bacterium]
MAKKKATKKGFSAATKVRTKSDTFGELASSNELSRKQVACLFDDLAGLIRADLGKKGPGVFVVPGLMKIKVIHKPATKARKGLNPFTGQEMMFKAKPARNVVKVLALKGLKTMV